MKRLFCTMLLLTISIVVMPGAAGRAEQAQPTPLRIIAFGAHPDDAELKASGVAALWAAAGHKVKFVAMTNGDVGHFDEAGGPLARRRKRKSRSAPGFSASRTKCSTSTTASSSPRSSTGKHGRALIREWQADIVMGHRPVRLSPRPPLHGRPDGRRGGASSSRRSSCPTRRRPHATRCSCTTPTASRIRSRSRRRWWSASMRPRRRSGSASRRCRRSSATRIRGRAARSRTCRQGDGERQAYLLDLVKKRTVPWPISIAIASSRSTGGSAARRSSTRRRFSLAQYGRQAAVGGIEGDVPDAALRSVGCAVVGTRFVVGNS